MKVSIIFFYMFWNGNIEFSTWKRCSANYPITDEIVIPDDVPGSVDGKLKGTICEKITGEQK